MNHNAEEPSQMQLLYKYGIWPAMVKMKRLCSSSDNDDVGFGGSSPVDG
jgi:hypothetical protein